MVFGFLAFVFLFTFYLAYLQKRPKGFPPGPFVLPIVGNLFQVGLEPHKALMNMRKNYGDIIGISLGSKRAVFINDYGLLKAAFNSISLCGRPRIPHFAEPETGEMRGIGGSSGKTWIEQRRFIFSYLQSEARNEVSMESLILKEANELVEYLKKNCQQPISTYNIFNIPIINSLWSISTGERYSLTDQNILKITNHINQSASSISVQAAMFYPEWAKLFSWFPGYKRRIVSNIHPVLTFIQCVIDRHKESYQEVIQRDLVDCYLQKIRNTNDSTSSFFGKLGEVNLRYCLHDIFFAGTETVSTTLRWLVFLMSHYPEAQEKLINTITVYLQGREEPLLKDRLKLPFVEALINEVLRFSSITPMGVFHEAVENVKFREYLIPTGTMVIGNQYAILHDPAIWTDPEKFRPERFLNEEETEIIYHPAFIPFSTGRRVCPGESLARDELFLFTMKIFQEFKVGFDPGVPTPPLKSVLSSVVYPIDHKIQFSMKL